MPLHEYLEQKRRQNIAALNASGACHICGSTGRNSRGFHHFLDDEDDERKPAAAGGGGGGDDDDGGEGSGSYSSENSLVPRPSIAAMRTCACFGQSPDDPDYWPYSLRVCDKCIEDDAGIGRIRSCGICGTVACDENCGSELLECTDRAAWNNAGCLECRKKSDFSEIDIFRRSANVNRGRGPGEGPRITRICARCLDTCTPWVKYDFVCRRFRCETRLVPSDVAERKRFCTFGSSPLNLLPGDSLVAAVDFLSESDLKQLFLTCSAMCTVAERVAKEKVERVNDLYPTGPIDIAKRKDGLGQVKNWTHFEGKNDFGLRAPDDEKAWVGVYHYLKKITQEMFYFGFQTTGTDADQDAAERFINRLGRDNDANKFVFGRIYNGSHLVPAEATGVSLRGGCLLVTGDNVSPAPLTVASANVLTSGTCRLIYRLFCPGSGGARGNRDANSFRLGAVGLLRTDQPRPLAGEGPQNAWAHRADVTEGWLREDVVVGIEYDADARSLVVHSNSHVTRASRFAATRYTLPVGPGGDLRVAVELAGKAAGVAQTLLTVREVDADEWARFVDHTAEGVSGVAERVVVNAAAAVAARDHAADVFAVDADGEIVVRDAGEVAADGAANDAVNDADAVLRVEIRNRRRERERPDEGDDDEGPFQRAQARAMEEGRRVARVLLPRRDPPGHAAVAAGVARAPRGFAMAAAAPVEQQALPPRELRTRRVVRALRPFARAAAAPEEMHVDREEASAAAEQQPQRPHWMARGGAGDADGDESVDMDEEVAAGEFMRHVEVEQFWLPAEGLEPHEAERNAANDA